MSERTITKGRWKLEITESHGGDLFELEVRRRFSVYDLKTGACVLHFKGEDDYTLSGPEWAFEGSCGVQSVTLESDGLIVSYGNKNIRYQLPLRDIHSKELLELNPFFEAFQTAKQKYWYETDYAADVSIPVEALRESHREMMRAWDALEVVLMRLGIREMVFQNMTLPRRIKGGKKQVAGLLEWLQKGGHLRSREQVSRAR